MLKDIRITLKLPLVMIAFALMSALTTGAVAYLQAANSIKGQAKSNLYSLLESRESSLNHYFQTIENNIRYHANSHLIKSAFKDFSSAWEALPTSPQNHLKKHYLVNNPYSHAQRKYLLSAKDGSVYSKKHEQYHIEFTSLISAGLFYDLFLIDTAGNVIYTVTKESDFATNLIDGNWSTTGLASAFKKAQNSTEENKLHFVDFAPYGPSNFENASFISTVVLDQEGEVLGVLALQLSIEKLNQVMQVTAGMGKTGETYLVGPDLTMRSDSRFFSTSSILKTKVDTLPVEMAMDGQNSVIIAKDYRGINVYSAFKSINIMGERWAILAEIDESEVHEPIHSLNSFLILAGLIIGSLIAALGYFLSNDLASPIRAMTTVMNRLSNNDLSTNISVDERNDEVGSMAKALVEFKKFALEREKLQEHLSHIAKHDSLTGLPNREFIMPFLKAKTDRDNVENTGLTVMFADLDGFKQVNDRYGHSFGDEILRQVSERLKYCLRDQDVIARIGGDEFLIAFSEKTSAADCQKIADKIFVQVNTNHIVADKKIKIGISLGSATFPDDTTDTRELLKRADQAMYKAKSQGKNCYVAYGH